MATFLVGDPADTNAGTGLTGTLRYVLGQLNAVGGASNEIDFALGGTGVQTITLGSDLPTITKNVTIDGYKLNGAANTAAVGTNASILVQLDLGGHAGLVFAAGSANSIVKGLSIDHGSAAGITIQDNGVSVVGDFIGVMADGQTALANATGVSVASGVTGTIIGTSALADRNLIAGNTGAGIVAAGAATIKGNLIGTDKTGLAAAANGSGVRITGATGAVGGAAAGEANTIAFNTGAAVTVDTVSGIPISRNAIFQNGQGIVLLNNGNGNLVAPSSLAAASVTGLTTIEGQFTAPSAGSYTIELFASASGDPTATAGQAHIFLGQTVLNFASSGTKPFLVTSGIQVAAGQVVTATSTSTTLGTSTFAAAAGLSPAYTVTTTADSGIGSLRQAILDFQAAPGGTSKIDFNILGTGIHTITLASALPSITGTVSVDGTTEPGFTTTPVIRLDGNGVVTDGLTLSGSSTQTAQILSLDIVHFTGSGIRVLSGKNLIQNNVIGADPTAGAAGPGNLLGVVFVGSNNTLTGNTIAFNTSAAVTVDTGTSDTISRNIIFQNGQGITLANNGNNLLAAPSALALTSISGQTTIEGKFNAPSAGNYTLEFFASAAGDPTATPGQAHVFLGQKVVAFAAGSQAFQATSAIQVPAGQVVTATVTSTAGDTSAFAVPTGLTDPFVVTTTADNGIGSLREAITSADQNSDSNTISFAIPTSDPNYNTSANTWTIKPLTALPTISAAVTIDGTTPPQFFGVPVIQLDGSGLSGTHDGLNLVPGSNGSRIRSLAIYRFSGAGIHVQSNSNAIQGSDLGTDASGILTGAGNQTGLWIDNAASNTVGGLSGLGNLISGNTRDGVLLQGDGSTTNLLLGNKIGTDVSGSSGLANGRDGVRVVTTAAGLVVNDTIGGTANGAGNTIAFNVGAALTVDSAAGVAATRNSVFRNGQGIVLPNSGNQGLPAPSLTTVNSAGGNTQITGQLVGAPSSTSYTIEFFASASSDPTTGVQARTFLGTTAVAIGSTVISVTLPVSLAIGQNVVATATANTAPIETSPFSNAVTIANPFLVTNTADSGLGSLRQAIINANASTGTDTISFAIGGTGPFTIALASALPAITDPVVLDGTTQAGFSGTPVIILSGAGLSGTPDGLSFSPTANASTIRGLKIINFAGAGLRLQSSNDVVQGNVIGESGSPNGQGVAVTGNNNTIGGSGVSASNIITSNIGAGVTVSGGTGDAISHDSIFNNGGAGIALASGGNALQPAPVLTLVNSVAGTTLIQGTLSGSAPNTAYTLEFFASTSADPVTGDQARVFLGTASVTTNASGQAPISVSLPVAVPIDQRVTATATSAAPAANTSAFATAVIVASPFVVTNTADSGTGSLRQAILNANANRGPDSITFAIPGTAPFTIMPATPLPTISETLVLDATTQSGFAGTPIIRIDGGGQSSNGLTLGRRSDGSTIRGLNIVNFAGAGIVLQSGGDLLRGNFLGTNFLGDSPGPGALTSGILVSGSNNNAIGGAISGSSNVIAFVTGAAVTVDAGTGNEIRQNVIFQNGGPGIALLNGGNRNQPAPVLSLANSVSGTTTIVGTLTGSNPNTTYTLEFFASTTPAAGDQARVFLGSTLVLTDASGASAFSAALPVVVPVGQQVTATATSTAPLNDTSPFAGSVVVASPFLVTNTNASGSGSLRQALLNANVHPGLDTITFAISGPLIITPGSALPDISDPVFIDATTEPGYAGTPLVVLNGNNATGTGLTFGPGSSGSTVQGLTISGFTGSGIVIQSSNDVVSNNVITANVSSGVVVVSGSNNTISRDNVFENGSANTNTAINDIVLSPAANNDAPPPVITGVQLSAPNTLSVGLVFSFGANIPASGLSAALEFFRNNPVGRPFLISPGNPQTVLITPNANDPTKSNTITVFLDVTGQGFTIGSQLIATATFSGGGELDASGTSAFSNIEKTTSPFVVTNALDDGIGSLRKVLEYANRQTAPSCVMFALPAESLVIHITSAPLPIIGRRVNIDGSSQPGYDPAKPGTIVQIDGLSATNTRLLGDGLSFGVLKDEGGNVISRADGSSVQALSIFGFSGAGIKADGLNVTTSLLPAITIAGVIVGVDPLGILGAPGNGTGILLNQVTGGEVGLPVLNVFDTNCNPSPGTVAALNLISANSIVTIVSINFGTGNGIEIDGGSSNLVQSTIVGTSFLNVINPALNTGNTGDGILISNSFGNNLGASNVAATRNIISGNGKNGIHFTGAAAVNNSAFNNNIGTDRLGLTTNANIANKGDGILIDGGAGLETIGGQSLRQYNPDGTLIASNLHGNLISGNLGSGVEIVGGMGGNQVFGNLIGVTADGRGTLGNGLGPNPGDGVRISSSPSNLIGQSQAPFGNLIAGSGGDGVHIIGANSLGQGNTIQSNEIGALIGRPLFGNHGSGVRLTDGAADTIGVSSITSPVASDPLQAGFNIISGNGQDGVTIEYTTARTGAANTVGENVITHNGKNGVLVEGIPPALTPPPSYDVIRHNFIGTNGADVYVVLAGTTNPATQGNGLDGIRLHGVPAIVTANVVSGNGLSGVDVERGDSSTAYDLTGTLIDGNRLGTDLTGTRTVDLLTGGQSLPMGNVLDGVLLNNVVGVTVGGLAPNVMSGNLGRGVEVRGDQFDAFNNGQLPAGNLIVDNIIGLDVSGSNAVYVDPATRQHFNLGNLSDGIFLLNAPATTITGNTVSNDRGFGVHVIVQTSRTLLPNLFIQGNFIGTNNGGTRVVDAFGELLGNSGDGVFLDRVSHGSLFSNVISGNRANGINLLSSNSIVIFQNKIGTDVSGMLGGFGNASSGILLNQSSKNIIGGSLLNTNVISGNKASGIFVSGTTGSDASENIIAGDYIGTNATGTAAIANSVAGIILSQANNNQIGDPAPQMPTVISGNTLFGVLIANAATGNQIQGTLIGTDVTGSYAIPNTSDGVMLINVAGNTIGGPATGQRNVISGNGTDGIRIFGGLLTGGNLVTNNIIGLSKKGTLLLGSEGNQGDGVLVDNATPGNVIGPNNVISGNGQTGVSLFSVSGSGGTIVSGNFIGTDPTGERPEGNNGNGVSIFGSSRNDIGTTVPGTVNPNAPLYVGGNVISGNALAGVQIFSPASSAKADFNGVHGALIGTDLLGVNAIPNHADGIQILNGNHNLIGGMKGVGSSFILSDANLISGNELNGIYLDVFPTRDSTADVTGGNVIDGNLIGTDKSGSQSLGAISGAPQRNGVLINNGPVTYIGYVGADLPVIKNTVAPAIARNVISGNAVAGIQFAGRTSGNVVQGNDIGLRSDGTGGDTLANPFGIYVNNPGSFRSGNLIGGTTLGSGNIIAGGATPSQTDNTKVGAVGILISGPQDTRFQGGNAILGNLIGLDRNGVPAGSQIGVLVSNSSGNVIGGAVALAGNVISGNLAAGVEFFGPSSITNFVIGNHVGTNFEGSNLPAAFLPESAHRDGLQRIGIFTNNAYGNFIGLAGAGNVISGNLNGVVIEGINSSPAAVGNHVLGNYVGISADGTNAVPNFEDGVQINGSKSNEIATNIISANGSSGVNIIGELSGFNDVYANAIGVDSAGQSHFTNGNVSSRPSPTTIPGYSVFLGGQLNGVSIIGSSNNFIGVKGGNLIQGNLSVGLYVTALDFNNKRYAPPVKTMIQKNTITGNGIYGVLFFNAPQNNLDTTTRGTANKVFGNATNFLNFVSGLNGQTTLKAPVSVLLPPAKTTTAAGVPAGPAFFAKSRVTNAVQKSAAARVKGPALFPSGVRTLKLKSPK